LLNRIVNIQIPDLLRIVYSTPPPTTLHLQQTRWRFNLQQIINKTGNFIFRGNTLKGKVFK